MTKFSIFYTKSFKKSFKKIKHDKNLVAELKNIIEKLANNENLDKKHKNHSLSGNYQGYEECHIRPDFLLIYKKQLEILVLSVVDIGSHSDLFD